MWTLQITTTSVNTNYLYNIYTMLDKCQWQRRWADVVKMLYKCFVFTGTETPKEKIKMWNIIFISWGIWIYFPDKCCYYHYQIITSKWVLQYNLRWAFEFNFLILAIKYTVIFLRLFQALSKKIYEYSLIWSCVRSQHRDMVWRQKPNMAHHSQRLMQHQPLIY